MTYQNTIAGRAMHRLLSFAMPMLCLATMAASPAGMAAETAPAGTTTVFRCGPEGKTFSDKPCAGGRAEWVTPDLPDADRRQAAQEVASRQSRLAADLRAQRVQRESQPTSGASGFHPRPERSADDDAVPRKKKRQGPHTVDIPKDRQRGIHQQPGEAPPALAGR